MSKVIIETVDGVENATAIVEFDLGKVLRDKVSEDGKVHSVPVTMSIDGMIEFYRKLAYEKAMDGDMEGYEEILEQYVILKVNEIIGVESTPLTIDSTGVLVGLSESVEVDFKDNRHANIETSVKYYKEYKEKFIDTK